MSSATGKTMSASNAIPSDPVSSLVPSEQLVLLLGVARIGKEPLYLSAWLKVSYNDSIVCSVKVAALLDIRMAPAGHCINLYSFAIL